MPYYKAKSAKLAGPTAPGASGAVSADSLGRIPSAFVRLGPRQVRPLCYKSINLFKLYFVQGIQTLVRPVGDTKHRLERTHLEFEKHNQEFRKQV